MSNGSQNRVRRDVRPVEFDVDGEKYQFNFILSDHEVFPRNAPVWLAKSKTGNSPNYTYELVRDVRHSYKLQYFLIRPYFDNLLFKIVQEKLWNMIS